MLYTDNIPQFTNLVENYIAKRSTQILSKDDIDVCAEDLFVLGVSVIVLQQSGLSKEDMDVIITYLLEEYELEDASVPLMGGSLGLYPVSNSTNTVGITKPIPITDLNISQLVDLILATSPPSEGALTEDILVSAGITGLGVSPGDILVEGTSFTEAFKRVLIKQALPTYEAPVATLASTENGYKEIGVQISPALSVAFAQNDAGSVVSYQLSRGVTSLRTDASSPIDMSPYGDTITVVLGATTYSAVVGYAEGPVKNIMPSGVPYSPGRITAGATPSNNVGVVGIYPWFYGTSDTDTLPDIYAGTKVVNASNGSLYVPSFGSDTKWFWFAVPKNPDGTSQKIFTTWMRTALDAGPIGGSGSTNLFRSPIVASVSSTGLYADWTHDYDLYFSGYATDASKPTTLN